jgi:hypothetical protein
MIGNDAVIFEQDRSGPCFAQRQVPHRLIRLRLNQLAGETLDLNLQRHERSLR